jgi:hypothetical protein
VGCAGEVALVEAPDDQFKDYRIEIRQAQCRCAAL